MMVSSCVVVALCSYSQGMDLLDSDAVPATTTTVSDDTGYAAPYSAEWYANIADDTRDSGGCEYGQG